MAIFENDVDTFIAMDLADLPDVYFEHYGETMQDHDVELDEWSEVDPNRLLTIGCEEDDFHREESIYPPNAEIVQEEGSSWVLIKAPAHAWEKSNGRGFLCSTEY